MGATLFAEPASWQSTGLELKKRVAAAVPGLPAKNVKCVVDTVSHTRACVLSRPSSTQHIMRAYNKQPSGPAWA